MTTVSLRAPTFIPAVWHVWKLEVLRVEGMRVDSIHAEPLITSQLVSAPDDNVSLSTVALAAALVLCAAACIEVAALVTRAIWRSVRRCQDTENAVKLSTLSEASLGRSLDSGLSDGTASLDSMFGDSEDEGDKDEGDEDEGDEDEGDELPPSSSASHNDRPPVSPAASLRQPLRPPLRRRPSPWRDGALYRAFCEAAAGSGCGGLAKRQLYGALSSLGFEQLSATERLRTWRLFDRNDDGRVNWDEFRQLGAALLLCERDKDARRLYERVRADFEGAEQAPATGDDDSNDESRLHCAQQQRGGFAIEGRSLEQEQRWARTDSRIRSLARRRSLKRVRSAALR